jgi:hypothetical protein
VTADAPGDGDRQVSEPRGPVDQLLDVLVYAPLGFASEARQLVPRLAEKGRQQLDVQMRVARMLGRLAVKQGQREAGKILDRLREPAHVPTGRESTPAAPAGASDAVGTNGVGHEHRAVTIEHELGGRLVAAELAIPSYDELAASQVVPRLEGLRADELDAVRRYEVAHRGRKTILGKVAQLQRERASG